MTEFSLQKSFQVSARYWWLIILFTLLGGAAGFTFHLNHPEIYRATTTFYVTIDVDRLRALEIPHDQFQYNEDLALASTQMALRSTGLIQRIVQSLEEKGIAMGPAELVKNSRIERKHAFWELHYDHADPEMAILLVNIYAQLGYQAMLELQSEGVIVDYVIFTPPSLAEFAQGPVLYDRNNLILSGCVIGFVLAILVIEVWIKARI